MVSSFQFGFNPNPIEQTKYSTPGAMEQAGLEDLKAPWATSVIPAIWKNTETTGDIFKGSENISNLNTEAYEKGEELYAEEFKALGAEVFVTTVDGSVGTKGFVTDAVDAVGDYSYVYTCGPEVMLKAVYNKCEKSGQFSFEERMGCGFGACVGCTCKTKYGNKRICKDGPVLEKEEIIW